MRMFCPHEKTPEVFANGLTYRNRIRYIAVCPDCGLILMSGESRKSVEDWVSETYPDKGVC